MIIKASLPSNTRQFIKAYKVPISFTVLFMMLLAAVLGLRLYENALLSKLLSGNESLAQYYSALINRDKIDEFNKRAISEGANRPPRTGGNTRQADTSLPETPPNPSSAPGMPPPSPSPTPSPLPPPPPTPPPSPSPTPSPTPNVFTAWIYSFQNSSVSPVYCDGTMSTTQCFKKYRFDAVVRTLNGPGTVNYKWNISLGGANNGSFTVPAQEQYSPVNTEVTVSCNEPKTFTAQFGIISPTQVNSHIVTINHYC